MATPVKAARNARAASNAAAATITSRDNRWLKEFRMALRGGLQTESGCVGVEGVRLVEEALRSGCRIEGGAVQRIRRAPSRTSRAARSIGPEIAHSRSCEPRIDCLKASPIPSIRRAWPRWLQPRAATLDDILRVPGEACSAAARCSSGRAGSRATSARSCVPRRRLARRERSPPLRDRAAPPVRFRRRRCVLRLERRCICRFSLACRCRFC